MPVNTANLTPLEKRQILIRALRAEMPKDFTWNFNYVNLKSECGSTGCALGLAEVLGLIKFEEPEHEAFGLTAEDADAIFWKWEAYGVDLAREVTPLMVADALARLP